MSGDDEKHASGERLAEIRRSLKERLAARAREASLGESPIESSTARAAAAESASRLDQIRRHVKERLAAKAREVAITGPPIADPWAPPAAAGIRLTAATTAPASRPAPVQPAPAPANGAAATADAGRTGTANGTGAVAEIVTEDEIAKMRAAARAKLAAKGEAPADAGQNGDGGGKTVTAKKEVPKTADGKPDIEEIKRKAREKLAAKKAAEEGGDAVAKEAPAEPEESEESEDKAKKEVPKTADGKPDIEEIKRKAREKLAAKKAAGGGSDAAAKEAPAESEEKAKKEVPKKADGKPDLEEIKRKAREKLAAKKAAQGDGEEPAEVEEKSEKKPEAKKADLEEIKRKAREKLAVEKAAEGEGADGDQDGDSEVAETEDDTPSVPLKDRLAAAFKEEVPDDIEFVPLDRPVNEIILHEEVQAAEKFRPVLAGSEEERKKHAFRVLTAKRTAFVGLAATLVAAFALIVNQMRMEETYPTDFQFVDPDEAPERTYEHSTVFAHRQAWVAKLKEDFNEVKSVTDPELKEKMVAVNQEEADRLREFDWQMRRRFFDHLSMKEPGHILLLFCAAVFLLALRVAWVYNPTVPQPMPDKAKGEKQARERRWARRALTVVALLSAAVGLLLYFSESRREPGEELRAYLAQPKPLPPPEEIAANSIRLRGNDGAGHAPEGFELPETWNAGSDGGGILWAEKIPLEGLASPVVWNDYVIVAGANKAQRKVFAFAVGDGAIEWEAEVKIPGKVKVPDWVYDVDKDKHYMLAAPTPATDGHRIYVVFTNGTMAALDMNGLVKWRKDLGLLSKDENKWGHSQSPIVHRVDEFESVVIVPYDTDSGGFYAAYDGKSGEELWKADAPEGESYTTPVIVEREGASPMVVALGRQLMAFDVTTGEKLWEAGKFLGNVSPSPIVAGDKIIVSYKGKTLAYSFAGEEIWSSRGGPAFASPVADDEFVWWAKNGNVSCFGLADGELRYDQDIEDVDTVYSPLTLADGKLLLMDLKGKCVMIEASGEFAVAGEASFGEPVMSAPAFKDGRMFVRAEHTLFCVGKR